MSKKVMINLFFAFFPIVWGLFGINALLNNMYIDTYQYFLSLVSLIVLSIWIIFSDRLKSRYILVGISFVIISFIMYSLRDQPSYDYIIVVTRQFEDIFMFVGMGTIALGMKVKIDEFLEALEKNKMLANLDPLTNLANRRKIMNEIDQSIAYGEASANMVAYLMIDFDNFKNINDSYGHEYGDIVLIHITNIFKSIVKEEHFIGRLGGDEFLIIIRDVTDVDMVGKICTSIIKKFNEVQLIKNNLIHISGSVGVSVYPNDGDNHSILLQKADMAMYNVKKNGKNNFAFFNKTIEDNNETDMRLKVEIINALKMKTFRVYYQSIVSLHSDPQNYEALIRWNREGKIVSPAYFIPVAEKYGLISQIDYYIIESVCSEMKKLGEEGKPFGRVSINLSARTIMDPELIKNVRAITDKFQVKATSIAFEITETAILQNEGIAFGKIMQLRELGYKVSLDDFGTGFSSLNHLKRFPIDSIKIDKTFVDGISVNRKDEEVVRAILKLARALGIKTIAEGVENKDQVNFLVDNECDYIQGYYFSRPNDLEHTIAM